MRGTRATRAPWRHVVVAVAAATTLMTAACADDTTADRSADADTTTTAAGAPTTPTAPAAWTKVAAPEPCRCSDGSPFHSWTRAGDPERLLVYLEGGGACFNAATCGPERPTYKRSLAGDLPDRPGSAQGRAEFGIFDDDDPDNPVAGWSAVYVPYCTGDLHIGDTAHDYGDGLVVEHRGAVNLGSALEAAAAAFPDATQVVVVGTSAGSAGSPVAAGLIHDLLPDADVSVIADGSGAYPGTAPITLAISALWGTRNAVPDWPENAGLAPEQWSTTGVFVQAARHVPGLRIATVNTAYDETQARFAGMTGSAGQDLRTLIDDNTASIEAQGVEVHSWVGPGTLHTILTRPQFADVTVEGTSLRRWIADFVEGDDVADVHCVDCGAP